ncbi:MAG: N-acetylmuramoyl-L-alanine amidase [Bacteroidetes bacterium]|nr:N-acetylmuramoyl-L-alanine amidase [Bacteroidota bacterium]
MKILLSVLFIGFTIAFAQPQNLNGLKICIDPGHGGYGPNDRHVIPDAGLDFWESESNWNKALLLKPLLEARGASVIVTRSHNNYPDQQPSLAARWQFANSNNVHWFHSIHSNATGGTNTSTNSTLVLLKENKTTRQAAFPAAITMSSLIYSNIRAKNRTAATSGNIAGNPGVYLDYTFYGGPPNGFNLGVLSGLMMPGELSEGSFHDYYPETRRLLNNHYRKVEAYGIYNAFVEYYKIPYDTLGLICGTQKNGTVPINNIVVRLLPVNKVYNGDAFNNGYFLFDSLAPGSYKVVYETPGYSNDTVNVTLAATGRLASTTPLHNATAVLRNSTVVFNFIKPMDTAFVRSVFSISPVVEGNLIWNPENTVMTFLPKNLLSYKTMYTVSLAGLGNTLQPTVFVDNKTVTSNVVAKPIVVTFQTISLAPYVQLTQPSPNDTNFTVTQNVGIRFSESMDTASVRNAFQITPATVGSFTWTSSNPVNNTLLWKSVTGSLSYQTYYAITIGTAAKSVYNIAIDGNKDSVGGDQYSFQFRTQRQPVFVDGNSMLTMNYALHQNYPNPFNPVTNIRFSIAESGVAELFVYDILGRKVATLLNANLESGNYTVQWDASRSASGLYFYTLKTGNFFSMKRMMLMK